MRRVRGGYVRAIIQFVNPFSVWTGNKLALVKQYITEILQALLNFLY